MSKQKLLCPMRFAGGQLPATGMEVGPECVETECAWWCLKMHADKTDRGGCAIASLCALPGRLSSIAHKQNT